MYRIWLLFDPRRALVALFAFLFTLALLIHFILLSTPRFDWIGGGAAVPATCRRCRHCRHRIKPSGGCKPARLTKRRLAATGFFVSAWATPCLLEVTVPDHRTRKNGHAQFREKIPGARRHACSAETCSIFGSARSMSGFFGVTTHLLQHSRHRADHLGSGDRPDLEYLADRHRTPQYLLRPRASRHWSKAAYGKSSPSAPLAPSVHGPCAQVEICRKLGMGLHMCRSPMRWRCSPMSRLEHYPARADGRLGQWLSLWHHGAFGLGFKHRLQLSQLRIQPGAYDRGNLFFTTTFALALHASLVLSAINPVAKAKRSKPRNTRIRFSATSSAIPSARSASTALACSSRSAPGFSARCASSSAGRSGPRAGHPGGAGG